MGRNKISEFLTVDISYLLGLIVGGGEIQYSNQIKKIVINFKFKSLEAKAITRNYEQKLYLQMSLDSVILRLQNLGINIEKIIQEKAISLIMNWQKEDISWLFIKFLINGTKFSYNDFLIPESIFETNDENKKEFLRGLADVTAFVRNSNRDQIGRHRVYIEISNKNWFLPVQICNLLQSLNVAVAYIGYGHPNLRGEKNWAKEHQIKIYANDFLKIGFYISHKQEALKELADFNIKNFSNKKQKICNCEIKRFKEKTVNVDENSEILPKILRGKHFNHFKEICKELGCIRCMNVSK